jgi:hypothetical protein
MIGDVGQNVAQVRLRIDTVELGAKEQRLHDGGPIAVAVGPKAQEILAVRRDAARRIRGDVVVDFDDAILSVIQQRLPLGSM